MEGCGGGWNDGLEANSIAQCRECAEGLWCFVGGLFAQASQFMKHGVIFAGLHCFWS
jgi:hypothetical protein